MVKPWVCALLVHSVVVWHALKKNIVASFRITTMRSWGEGVNRVEFRSNTCSFYNSFFYFSRTVNNQSGHACQNILNGLLDNFSNIGAIRRILLLLRYKHFYHKTCMNYHYQI